MFRGNSLSGDNPGLTLGLSYDHSSGLYAGGTVTAIAGEHVGPRINGGTQYVGLAQRGFGLSFDTGIVHRSYSRRYSKEYATDYFEAYAGIAGRDIGTRFYYCPDFDGKGASSAYGEVNATFISREKWSLNGHVGGLLPPRETGHDSRMLDVDWRLGVSRSIERFSLSVDWAGAHHQSGEETDHRLVVSISRAF